MILIVFFYTLTQKISKDLYVIDLNENYAINQIDI